MSLTAETSRRSLRLLEESGFDELYLEIDGIKLTLKRSGAKASSQPPSAAGDSARSACANRSGRRRHRPLCDEAEVRSVVAPLLGTFYRAPKPGAPPFVEVGARVEAETIVGIIEVMKLMNTVRAGVQGTVAEILARDGALVEYGEILLRVRKSA